MSELKKTIVSLDLVGYSAIARILEESLGPNSVFELNSLIQELISKGISAVGLPRELTVISTTGDGALLWFDNSEIGLRFGVAAHSACQKWNEGKVDAYAHRLFRIGMATGNVSCTQGSDKLDMGGMTIVRACRLEPKTAPGSILIDKFSYVELPEVIQKSFNGPFEIQGKRDEVNIAYKCTCFVPGENVLAVLTGKTILPEKSSQNLNRGDLGKEKKAKSRAKSQIEIHSTSKGNQGTIITGGTVNVRN